jgi:hypothetical protein
LEADEEMKEASELLIQPESETKSCLELLEEWRQKMEAIGNSTPDLGIQELTGAPAPDPVTQSNPFSILGDDNAGTASLMEVQEDLKGDGLSKAARDSTRSRPHLGQTRSTSLRTSPARNSFQVERGA